MQINFHSFLWSYFGGKYKTHFLDKNSQRNFGEIIIPIFTKGANIFGHDCMLLWCILTKNKSWNYLGSE